MIKNFPCVALLGARQVGKTTLLKNLINPKTKIFDLEKSEDYELITRDPDFFLKSVPKPIIIDEAQIHPQLFGALRVFIDEKREDAGQIILTGSSSPELLKNLTESLAGRVGIVQIETLSINEIENSEVSPIYNILSQARLQELNLVTLHPRSWSDSVWWGGYPEILSKKDILFKRIWSEQYIQTYIDRDIRRLFPDLQIETYRRFIKMLAFSSGEIVNYSEWSSSLGVSEPTVKRYLDIAEGTYLFRKYPAFSFHPTKRLMKSPKGALRDTGLQTALLRIEHPDDLMSHPRAGFLFEIFCIEQIIKTLEHQMISFEFFHYRTKTQHEIDLIISFSKHLIPIEIKLGTVCRPESLKMLKQFIVENNCPFGVIINNSESILEVAPRIYQIPFSAL